MLSLISKTTRQGHQISEQIASDTMRTRHVVTDVMERRRRRRAENLSPSQAPSRQAGRDGFRVSPAASTDCVRVVGVAPPPTPAVSSATKALPLPRRMVAAATGSARSLARPPVPLSLHRLRSRQTAGVGAGAEECRRLIRTYLSQPPSAFPAPTTRTQNQQQTMMRGLSAHSVTEADCAPANQHRAEWRGKYEPGEPCPHGKTGPTLLRAGIGHASDGLSLTRRCLRRPHGMRGAC